MKFNIYMNCRAKVEFSSIGEFSPRIIILKVAEIFSEFNEREKQHVIDNPNDFKAIIPYEFFEVRIFYFIYSALFKKSIFESSISVKF